MREMTYNPSVFETQDIESARRIILTRERDMDTNERWVRETPYLVEMISQTVAPKAGEIIVDYGCGIGRLAKPLIDTFGCHVLGVDISKTMRGLAPEYVGSNAFSAVSRGMLQQLIATGFRYHKAYSVWVLQHCANPEQDIDLLAAGLAPTGALLVVNNDRRAVPAVETPWIDDGIDVADLLTRRFNLEKHGRLDPGHVGDHISAGTFWGAYRARP